MELVLLSDRKSKSFSSLRRNLILEGGTNCITKEALSFYMNSQIMVLKRI